MMDNWGRFIKVYNGFQCEEIEKLTGTIFHYTSPNGLKGIFDSSSLFATDMYFLNDASEGMYVTQLILEHISELCRNNKELIRCVERELNLVSLGKWEELIHNYIISFSCNGDSLEMWNYYTKGNSIQGYNIGFDVEKLANTIQIEILDESGKQIERSESKHLKLYQGKVIYDKDKQMILVKKIFDSFCDLYEEINSEEFLSQAARYMVAKTINYGQFFKAKEFAVEEEYRFIYATYLLEGISNLKKGIPCTEKFRIHEGCLIPYQKCRFDVNSIDAITFSPSLHNDMAEAGLIRLLKQHRIFGDDMIRKSNIPLRF